VNAGPDIREAGTAVDLFDRSAQALAASPLRRGCAVRVPARGRLLATGDLHDNPFHFEKIMRLARLDQSPDHHVFLHELIHSERLVNGLDLSHRILARVADLVLRYSGQAHPLLANHELCQMTGAGVSKGAGNSVQLFNDGLEYAYGDDAEAVAHAIRGFIRAMPLALLSESGVLCAHSLPAAGAMARFDESVLDRALEARDYLSPDGAAYLMVWGRGHTPEQVARLAARWNVRLFILGHEYVETGCEMRGDRVIVLNSDHEHGAVLPIDLADPPTAEEAMMSRIPLASIS
jgi:hypothetical protein